MTTYVSNCGSDFGEMICVNKWDTEDDVVSYDSESGFGGGMTYHDSLDAASGELNWDQPSPQFGTCRGMNFNREPIIFSDLEHWSDANCDDSSDRNCYDAFDGNCDYQYGYSISEISGTRHDESCSMKYDTTWNESNAYTDYEVASLGNDVKHEVDTNGYGRYAEFNHVDASRTHCPSYAPSTHLTHKHMRPHTYQFPGHHPTSFSIHKEPHRLSRSAPYVPPHLRQYSTQRKAFPPYPKPPYIRPHHNCPPLSPHTAHNSIPSHLTHVSPSRRNYRPHTYATTASAYTPPPYERFVPQTVIEEVPLSSSLEAQRKKHLGVNLAGEGTCEIDEVCNDDRADFGNFHVAQPMVLREPCTAGPIDDFVPLELLVEQKSNISKKLCYVAEESQQLGEETFLSFVEQEKLVDTATVVGLNELEGAVIKLTVSLPCLVEKCEQLAASLPCLESEKLLDNVFVMGEQQKEGLKQDENNMVVESSHGNEEKTEQSVGLKNAMRCLKLQRKFWGIGSLLSVIPAVPIHHFDDPFLLGAKGVHGVPSAYEAACFGEVYSSGLSYFLSSLSAANKGTSKHSFLPYDNEFPVSLRRLLMVSWQQHLQSEWIDTFPSTWHALWRPPDTRVRVNDSLVHLLALNSSWFGIWRPPDFIFRHERFGSSMVGFYFDKGRPPDSTTSFFVSTAQLRGRSPLKRDGLMHSQKLKDLIENVRSCRDLRGSDLLVNSFRLRTYFNYVLLCVLFPKL